MTDSDVTARCRTCKSSLSPKHTGPCPYCGNTGKEITTTINEKVIVTEKINVDIKAQRIKKNYKILGLLIGGFIGSSIFGYIVGGPIGLAVGLIAGGLSLGFGYKGITKTNFHKSYSS